MALLVSGSYFPVLGLQPALGRLLSPADDLTAGAHRVVVLSHAYWRSRFGEDPSILNDTLVINGEPMTVVGVAPRGFHGTTTEDSPEVFVPLTMSAAIHSDYEDLESRSDHWLYLFGRLKPGNRTDSRRVLDARGICRHHAEHRACGIQRQFAATVSNTSPEKCFSPMVLAGSNRIAAR